MNRIFFLFLISAGLVWISISGLSKSEAVGKEKAAEISFDGISKATKPKPKKNEHLGYTPCG